PDRPLGGLSHGGVGLPQQGIELLAVVDPLAELGGLCGQLPSERVSISPSQSLTVRARSTIFLNRLPSPAWRMKSNALIASSSMTPTQTGPCCGRLPEPATLSCLGRIYQVI
ncbi:MAG TPA: hypothetical protein VKJ83_01145, partial [Actinomycetota bacterium]|nr:hypothetical protein [Actinomycetota bacterium]